MSLPSALVEKGGKSMSNKPPSRIRGNIETFDDPYTERESPPENSVCKCCGSVHTADRWYLKGQVPYDKATHATTFETTCPACRQQSDKVPGGVLTLTGAFVVSHSEEILNLIRNESAKAQSGNPLERIMDMQSEGAEMVITTTNDRLAERIGRALHKAYRGEIEYQFGEDTKLARVNWRRE